MGIEEAQGIGGFIGSKMAGYLYGNYGDKSVVAQKYLAQHLGGDADWNGKLETLDVAAGVERTEAFAKVQELTGLDPIAATTLLWDTYSPQYTVWIPFAVIGVFATVALVVFGHMAKRWKDMDA